MSLKKKVLILMLVLFISLPISAVVWVYHHHQKLFTSTVLTKSIIESEGKKQYLIVTTHGTIEVSNSLFHFVVNKKKIFDNIESGKCYEFSVYGRRNLKKQIFRKICSINLVECSAP